MNRFVAVSAMAASLILGIGSMAGLVWFLWFGAFPFGPGPALDGAGARLALDFALCLGFMIPHSLLVRPRICRRLKVLCPGVYQPAVYAIVSGATLLALLLFWQPVGTPVYDLPGLQGWATRLLLVLAGIITVWAGLAIKGFDPLGITPLRHALADMETRPLPFVVAGPYRWVRHPLYLASILALWCHPAPTWDRMLFNGVFTIWIVLGTLWEEGDLAEAFGEDYREYQSRVPMLVPWRRPWPGEDDYSK